MHCGYCHMQAGRFKSLPIHRESTPRAINSIASIAGRLEFESTLSDDSRLRKEVLNPFRCPGISCWLSSAVEHSRARR